MIQIVGLLIVMWAGIAVGQEPVAVQPQKLFLQELQIASNRPVRLDEEYIALREKEYAKDFAVRSYLAKGTYVSGALAVTWFAYKLGVFNFFFPGAKNEADTIPVIDEPASFESLKEALSKALAVMRSQHARLEQLESHKETSDNWLLSTIKSVGWTGLTVATSILIQTRWKSFFDYALAEPSYQWFLTKHSFLPILDRIIHTGTTAHHNNQVNEYLHKGVDQGVSSLAHNLQELIAFTDYYLATLDPNTVHDKAMDGASRALLHMSNDFLQQTDDALLKNASQDTARIAQQFKADLTHWLQRAALFEQEINE